MKGYAGDSERITVIGQSAGAAHLASAIFLGLLKKSNVFLEGVILLGGPLRYDLRQERRKKNMFLYRNTNSEEVLKKMAVAFFCNGNLEDIDLDKFVIVLGEYDSEEIARSNIIFVEEYLKKLKRLPVLEVLEGENHISYFLRIGLEGDRLGKSILEFVGN